MRAARLSVAALVPLAACALAAPAANASFHLVKVREVFPGTTASPASAFIELQMYAPGQNLVAGHSINYYTGTGSLLGTSTFPANVGNGEDQRTVLLGDTATAVTPDYVNGTLGAALHPFTAGGAVCWENIDCVSWGNFSGGGLLPSATGNPVLAGGIPDGSSITRSITPNCSTLLEDADDTNNSAADFTQTSPTPRNNSTAPTEQSCPDTNIDKGPKKKVKTKKKKAKVTFKFSGAGATTFECKFDKADFELCSSPDKLKAKKGKHSFQVRGINAGGGVDPTPATLDFKVKRKK